MNIFEKTIATKTELGIMDYDGNTTNVYKKFN